VQYQVQFCNSLRSTNKNCFGFQVKAYPTWGRPLTNVHNTASLANQSLEVWPAWDVPQSPNFHCWLSSLNLFKSLKIIENKYIKKGTNKVNRAPKPRGLQNFQNLFPAFTSPLEISQPEKFVSPVLGIATCSSTLFRSVIIGSLDSAIDGVACLRNWNRLYRSFPWAWFMLKQMQLQYFVNKYFCFCRVILWWIRVFFRFHNEGRWLKRESACERDFNSNELLYVISTWKKYLNLAWYKGVKENTCEE